MRRIHQALLSSAVGFGLAVLLSTALVLRPRQPATPGATTYTQPGLAALSQGTLNRKYQIAFWQDVRATNPTTWTQAVAACGADFDPGKPNCMPVVLLAQTDQLAALIDDNNARSKALAAAASQPPPQPLPPSPGASR